MTCGRANAGGDPHTGHGSRRSGARDLPARPVRRGASAGRPPAEPAAGRYRPDDAAAARDRDWIAQALGHASISRTWPPRPIVRLGEPVPTSLSIPNGHRCCASGPASRRPGMARSGTCPRGDASVRGAARSSSPAWSSPASRARPRPRIGRGAPSQGVGDDVLERGRHTFRRRDLESVRSWRRGRRRGSSGGGRSCPRTPGWGGAAQVGERGFAAQADEVLPGGDLDRHACR
jgi:hypothetical protein